MIELRHITKTYKMGAVEVHALRDVSLKITPGEFVAIMGPSGSGKSTLMHIVGFLDRPDSGAYLLGDRDITELGDDELAILRNRLAGFVFQQFHLLPRISAVENAELPLIYAGRRHLKEKAHEKMREVGLAQRESHRPNELSGGEQQRVAIARSLVNEPFIIFADEPTGNLDTKSEEEIIALLEDLNRKGKTILMVTHEQEIAARARRIIRMRDGEIVADERKRARRKKPVAMPQGLSIDAILSESRQTLAQAAFIDHFRQALHAIVSHKMRSFLSMVGILIGIASVIAMLALGQGAKESITKQLASLGSNLLSIRPGASQMGGVALEAGTVTRFTLQDADAIAKLTGTISRVSPSVSGRGQLVYGNKNWNTQVLGTGTNYAPMRAAIPAIGRFFTEDELRKRDKLVVLGTSVVTNLFGDANPINAAIKINRINFKVIGVMPKKGASPFRDQDDVVVIPVTTAMYRVLGKQYVDFIDAEVRDPLLMDEAQDAISKLVIKRHNLTKDRQDTFNIRNMADIQATLQSTTRTMTWLLGSIAAISLLVGGIGIMNIMLVSVSERTREIGLRKAIGARKKDIMVQFLIEAVLMTMSGGIAGILCGIGMSFLLALLAGWATKVSIFAIVLATTFSLFVGVGFGLWPARQAARLNPIEALRYE
ncbi:MAG: MacB family efflux pump subunit [Deltaproteobacteria bacterium RBG_16_54_11]|nr:MAG: MacB family efflux pump subunit [Deltaproteobacteria bacterium RBG_16_54_11]